MDKLTLDGVFPGDQCFITLGGDFPLSDCRMFIVKERSDKKNTLPSFVNFLSISDWFLKFKNGTHPMNREKLVSFDSPFDSYLEINFDNAFEHGEMAVLKSLKKVGLVDDNDLNKLSDLVKGCTAGPDGKATPEDALKALNALHAMDLCDEIDKALRLAGHSGNLSAILMEALHKSDTEMMQMLLAKADFNAKDSDGNTPLTLASYNGHHKIVELLLGVVADVNAKDSDGNTPLTLASYNGHHKIVELLLGVVADVNAKDSDGDTALILASYNSHFDTAKLLIDNGADVNATDKDGLTALMLASGNGHQGIVERLLKEQCINVDVKGSAGNAALMYASYNGREKIVERLLGRGANFKIKTKMGRTLLMLASIHGHQGIVKRLLEEKDIDVNAVDKDGQTALMYASKKGHSNIERQLIVKVADVNATDKDGQTALMHASNKVEDRGGAVAAIGAGVGAGVGAGFALSSSLISAGLVVGTGGWVLVAVGAIVASIITYKMACYIIGRQRGNSDNKSCALTIKDNNTRGEPQPSSDGERSAAAISF